MVSFVFYGQVIINCLEINLKVESSRFFFKYDKKETFGHNNSRDTFCTLQYTVKQFYSDNLLRQPLRRRFLNYHLNRKEGVFHSREQGKMPFTTRLTSLILQQYKIGFKVELKNIKVIVVINGVTSIDEILFSVFRNMNGAINKLGK